MASMRGRFAPSPTGYIHLGNVWSAFLAWLQVRQAGGTLVLRIEDIDEQRSKAVYTKALMEDLSWLGLDWDEGPDVGGPYGPYVQQERYDRYDEALDVLREKACFIPATAVGRGFRPSGRLMPANIRCTTAIVMA